MNMENRSTWAPYLGEPVGAESMADVCDQPPDSRPATWKRAHRLYVIGELGAAAQLFARLAESADTIQEELAVEAAHG